MKKLFTLLFISLGFFACSMIKTRDHSEAFERFEKKFPVTTKRPSNGPSRD